MALVEWSARHFRISPCMSAENATCACDGSACPPQQQHHQGCMRPDAVGSVFVCCTAACFVHRPGQAVLHHANSIHAAVATHGPLLASRRDHSTCKQQACHCCLSDRAARGERPRCTDVPDTVSWCLWCGSAPHSLPRAGSLLLSRLQDHWLNNHVQNSHVQSARVAQLHACLSYVLSSG